jgi:hypothetical protein
MNEKPLIGNLDSRATSTLGDEHLIVQHIKFIAPLLFRFLI